MVSALCSEARITLAHVGKVSMEKIVNMVILSGILCMVESAYCIVFVIVNLQTDLEVDPCSSDPCQNHGVCVVQRAQNYTCICQVGYYGDNCELGNVYGMELLKCIQ